MSGALDRVRVLDLSRGVAAPYTAVLLAEQGGEVLRAEPPARVRLVGTAAFHVFNRSKWLMLLDIQLEEDQQRIRARAAESDVVIVDTPEVAARAPGLRLQNADTGSGRPHPDAQPRRQDTSGE